jgi:signal transduction histidine kinase
MLESEEIQNRIKNGEIVAPFETVRLCKNGAQINVSLSVSPVKDRDGYIIGVSKSARDIRQLKHARQEREALLRSERMAREAAESANRAKDEFLAMLGHEMRNPLHAISLASQLLQNPNSLEKARGIITRQGEHISRLVDDSLMQRASPAEELCSVVDRWSWLNWFQECIGTLRETGQIDRYTLEADLENIWIDGDSARLTQIVMNLLGNAVSTHHWAVTSECASQVGRWG